MFDPGRRWKSRALLSASPGDTEVASCRTVRSRLAWCAGPDVSAAEVGRVLFEQPDLLLGQNEGVAAGFDFQLHQPLVAALQVVTQPDAANSRR
jgi:hypothetical protein